MAILAATIEHLGQEYGNVELRDTLLEDANAFERIQPSIEAGLVPNFSFQDHEICCRTRYNTAKSSVEDWGKSQLAATSQSPSLRFPARN
jgi:hypothetical protein